MLENEVPAADRQTHNWRNPLDCSPKSTVMVKRDLTLDLNKIQKGALAGGLKITPPATSKFAESVITVWQIDIRQLMRWWSQNQEKIKINDEKLRSQEPRNWRNPLDCWCKSTSEIQHRKAKTMISENPEFQEFNRLFAQMACSKSKLLRFCLPEHSICQNVLQIRNRGVPGVEFLWDDFADVLSWV